MRNRGGGLVRRPATISAFSLLALAAVGCAAPDASPEPARLRAPARPSIVFENAGIEPVRLYLSERNSQWFVGYILPGKTEALPLPAAIAQSPRGRQLTLVVVPSSTARSARGGATDALPTPITSDAFSTDYLTTVRWRVVGRWVTVLPRRPAP